VRSRSTPSGTAFHEDEADAKRYLDAAMRSVAPARWGTKPPRVLSWSVV